MQVPPLLVPSRRWFLGGAALALVGLAGLTLPDASSWLLALDGLWLVMLVVDGFLTASARATSRCGARRRPPSRSGGNCR